MGWTIPYNMPHRTDLIRERLATWRGDKGNVQSILRYLLPGEPVSIEAKPEDYRWEVVTLKSCYKGGVRSGVLWAVRETRYIRKSDEVIVAADRWISCDLLRYYAEGRGMGSWGYKDMEESSGPSSDSCPISYLDMVPVPTNKDGSPQEFAVKWRERVRARKASIYKPKLLECVELRGCIIEWVRVVSLRPLLGRDENDRLVQIPRRCIVGKYHGQQTVEKQA